MPCRARTVLEGKEDDTAEYEERILYRLKTREIIDKDEYDRRFRGDAKKGGE